MKILNVKVDNISKDEIIQKVGQFLEEKKFHQIVTVNPEFILQAQKDETFKNILNTADLSVIDGIGINFACLRQFKHLKARLAGIDLVLNILEYADKNNLSVFLASYNGALSSWNETRVTILEKYPSLKIGGELMDIECPFGCPLPEAVLNYDIVFCNFGSPSQEKFINSLKSIKNSKIKLAMGVGGSFDFLTGKRKRAPKFLQKNGLEWLWRFCGEPRRRFKRIWNAVIIFPIRVLINK